MSTKTTQEQKDMRNAISSIVKKIVSTTFAAGLALAVLGTAANAAEPTIQERAEQEMNAGKDYVAAWADATRAAPPAYSPELVARAMKAEDALMQGQDYVAAFQAGNLSTVVPFTHEQIAHASLAQGEMNEGKDYVAAWEESAGATETR